MTSEQKSLQAAFPERRGAVPPSLKPKTHPAGFKVNDAGQNLACQSLFTFARPSNIFLIFLFQSASSQFAEDLWTFTHIQVLCVPFNIVVILVSFCRMKNLNIHLWDSLHAHRCVEGELRSNTPSTSGILQRYLSSKQISSGF